MTGAPQIRWRATVFYRVEGGVVDVVHDLQEIADLHDLVEAGPHWDCIVRVVIERVNHNTSACLTVEQALKL